MTARRARLHRMEWPIFAAAAACLVCCVAAAQEPSLGISRAVGAALAKAKLAPGDVGVHVVSTRTGRVLYSVNGSKPFIPASNMKLLTAATAIEALGPDYEFATILFARGTVSEGTLNGDLILHGGGDPTLGGRYDAEDALVIFGRWADVLKAKGITRVTGDVVGDDSFFDRTYRHPSWDRYPAWKWYYTTTSALSVNDNCVAVTVQPAGSSGAAALISVLPPGAPVRFANGCKTHAQKHSIWFDREAGSDEIKVGGYVRLGTQGYTHLVTVPDPPALAAAALRAALQTGGIAVDGRARAAAPGESAPAGSPALCVRRTRLAPVLGTMLQYSHNHYAEQVVKVIGAETTGRGTWEAGLARMGDLAGRLGFRSSEFVLDDGSGLSRDSRMPPALLATLLVAMARSEAGGQFVGMLAVPGGDGTLGGRLLKEPYRSRLHAKTGYLNGAGALSGYARTQSGEEVAFSIIVNDDHNTPGTYSMRGIIDPLARAIVDYPG